MRRQLASPLAASRGHIVRHWLRAGATSCAIGSVVEVRDVVEGVAAVALGSVAGDAQVVEAGEEDEDSDDEDRHGALRTL